MKKSFKEAVLLLRIRRMASKCQDPSVAYSEMVPVCYAVNEIWQIWSDRFEELSVQDISQRIPTMSLREALVEYDRAVYRPKELLKKHILGLYAAYVCTTATEAFEMYVKTWSLDDAVKKHFWDAHVRLVETEAHRCSSTEEARDQAFSRDNYKEIKEIWCRRLDEICYQDALRRAPLCTSSAEARKEGREGCYSEKGRTIWDARFIELSEKEAPEASALCESVDTALEQYNSMVDGTVAKEVWGTRLAVLVGRQMKTVKERKEIAKMFRSMSGCTAALQQLNIRYMELTLGKC